MEFLIKTERLGLRNFLPSDVYEIYDYRNNELCAEFQRWEDCSLDYLKNYVNQYASSEFLSHAGEQHYAVCLLSGEMIGDISIFCSENEKCLTLGFTVSYKHHRQGYAYEILSALVLVLRNAFPGYELTALIERENNPSIELVKKLGFQLECWAESIKSYIYVIPAE